MIEIQQCRTTEDIFKCTDVMLDLRPHISRDAFLPMVQEMIEEGFKMAFIASGGRAVAVVGYRYLQFLYNGKHIYIDDLATLPDHRGNGYGGLLLDYVIDEARKSGYKVVALDSGHQRYTAHRLYLNKGFNIIAHHFAKTLD